MTAYTFPPAITYLTDVGAANAYVSTRERNALELMRKLLCDSEHCSTGALWVRIYGHVIIRRRSDNEWDFIPHERPIALGVSIDQIVAYILASNW